MCLHNFGGPLSAEYNNNTTFKLGDVGFKNIVKHYITLKYSLPMNQILFIL